MLNNFSISIRGIFTISVLTLKEALRKKFVLVIIFTSGIFLLLNFLCEPSSIKVNSNGEEKNVSSIGSYIVFILISFWSMAISGLMTAGLISDELENKNYIMVLSKPVSRLTYLLGKFFGVFFLVLCNAVIFLIIQNVLTIAKSGKFEINLWLSLFIMLLDFVLLISIVMFLTIQVNKIAGIFLSLALVVITTLINIPIYDSSISQSLELAPTKKAILEILYWVLPQFGTVFFQASTHVAKSVTQTHYLGYYSMIQVSVWIFIVWVFLSVLFEKKELD
ncbi:MAG: ABC transporter permease [Leptospiraceae bacterium]|nr:ABC transporter permease [Leptospiraceae bacterium]MCK6381473.1 ABC transporter permease [Leptospiraceae bacterium]NUM40188.1 ABC transporter permease [Leptospiraceae bacterium]